MFTKGREMGRKTYLCTNKDTHTSTDVLTGWAGLTLPVLCIKAYQILLQRTV